MKDKKKLREYQRQWLAQRKQVWFDENGPCVSCGSWKDLELDHIDPSSKVTHRVWSWSQERRDEELSKCQVLCRSCHLAKTKQYRLDNAKPCGTRIKYERGCRCDDCCEALREHWRKRRNKSIPR